MSSVSLLGVSVKVRKGAAPPESNLPTANSAMYSHMRCAKSSPPIPGRKPSIQDLYSLRPANRSSFLVNDGSKSAAMVGKSFRAATIKRWDGNCRTTTVWDSLKRDPELWFPDGDCLIHFYEAGQSRRGASLRISLADIEASNCGPFLDLYRPFSSLEVSPSTTSSPSSNGEHVGTHSFATKYEIYVPAPSHLSTVDAFRYHLTTRNFFAWMFDLPIVGDRLGEALSATLERMRIYRLDIEDNLEDFLPYLDSQGYTDFRECPDHSLAILQFAERYELKELWTDAFVHCAGMNNNLIGSGEFESITRTSKALVTRAYLEMNLRLERAGKSLDTFLDEDLSGAYLGLGVAAQAHLDRFRSWLTSFYVGKFGYWPPTPINGRSHSLPVSIYRSMYFEFRKLYEFLVDPLSSNSFQDNRPADGGLCVLQNIKAFDKRHKYASLPHPLPLVPEVPRYMPKQKSSGMLRVFGSRHGRSDRRETALAALSAATNPDSLAITECPLVREYLYFEKSWTMKEFETVTCAEARKVRWILIYAVLQTLIGVTRAPREVRDTDGVSYPLCCQLTGTPPWKIGIDATKEKPVGLLTVEPEKVMEIKPDLDYSPPEQSPIALNTTPSRPLSIPRNALIGQGSDLDLSYPLKASTCDVQFKGYDNIHDTSFYSDPSTPSSTVGRAGSGGWSLSSSDNGMDHRSVDGSINNYGENEEDRVSCGTDDPQEVAIMASTGCFRPNICNSEVQRSIWT